MNLSTKPNATNGSARFQLPTVAFFGRTMTEYLQMLALDQGQLRGLAILDFASGPGSFVAESLAMGLDVKDRSANGTSASVGRAGRVTRSNNRNRSGWMRTDCGGSEERPIHAQGQICLVSADRS